MNNKNPVVSVIIPTKNSADYLVKCLESIKNQTYRNIEIIVVDNSSSDKTKVIARKFTDKVFNKGSERSAQVNFGAEKAEGEYIYKVDSDFILERDVIKQCLEEIQKGYDAIVVHNSPDESVSWIAKIRKFEVDMYKYNLDHSSARFIKKDVFQKIGGYNEKITAGEDYDLQNKLNRDGYKTGYISKEAIHLGEPTLIFNVIKKSYLYGMDLTKYEKENKKMFKKQMTPFRKVYFNNYKKFIQQPLIGIGFIFYNFIKFTSGGIGYLIAQYFSRKKTNQKILYLIKDTIDIKPEDKSQALVSIIIACKNTAKYFEKCLISIKKQSYKNIEIIVVDNFSTDGTYEVAKKYADKIFQKGPERCTQFNYGFKHSKGKYIYRIEPDYVLNTDVVTKSVVKMNEGFDAVALHNRSVGSSIWAKVRFYERESYYKDELIVAVRFMKRNVFENVGMFDENLVAGEDFDLHNRIVKAGYRWTHVEAIENHIGEPENVIEVWNKFYYYGKTIKNYHKKNKEIADKQLILFRPSFKKIHKEISKSPKLLIFFYIYLIIKYLAGGCGVIVSTISSKFKR